MYNPMDKNNRAYFLCMCEAEGITGIVDTRDARINAAIKDFVFVARQGLNIDDNNIQSIILEDHNLEDITPEESAYIAREVTKRI